MGLTARRCLLLGLRFQCSRELTLLSRHGNLQSTKTLWGFWTLGSAPMFVLTKEYFVQILKMRWMFRLALLLPALISSMQIFKALSSRSSLSSPIWLCFTSTATGFQARPPPYVHYSTLCNCLYIGGLNTNNCYSFEIQPSTPLFSFNSKLQVKEEVNCFTWKWEQVDLLEAATRLKEREGWISFKVGAG